jgi:hypothetical protein
MQMFIISTFAPSPYKHTYTNPAHVIMGLLAWLPKFVKCLDVYHHSKISDA